MSGVNILIDEVSPLLQRCRTAAQAQKLALIGAHDVAILVKNHLYGLEGQRHQYGRHFYRGAGDSVHTSAVPEGAAVSITQLGIRQRLLGGDIFPTNAGALTIPACPEAVGMKAADFPNQLQRKKVLDPKTGSLRWALVRRASTAIAFRHRMRTDGTVKTFVRPSEFRDEQVMFWLAGHVHQEPDPTVLPYEEQMTLHAVDAIKLRFERLALRQAYREGK
jgi:hypothetical protein